ncbi:Mitochondrial chaperone BCS1 [Gracilariopsis chorda]|uniref:Mitochondrial chaperone BCS1 n=1 Tax=Gracilariopsis chorda TaxID=448386 RepID=A0A2V3IE99_9FLOR|nr:Mitochondrial chaperone BCS1 [Gracilariopsis chorda]|eukprot:PXF40393.1 Mitochondrial chaperone BCS1 [Gracilariopsis chorda]
MTTNHMERLESALIRGGRVDRRFHFDWPSERQLQRLFLTYYKDASEELAAEFARAVFERPEGIEARSIATLQQLFVYFRETPAKDCVVGVDEFFEMHLGTSDPPSRGVPVFSQEKRNGSAVGSPTETSIIQAVEDEKIQKQQRKKNITHTPA